MHKTARRVAALTPRPQKELLALLRSGRVALAFDDQKLVGWLVAVPYLRTAQELGMGYVDPAYRKQGVLGQMIDLVVGRRQVSIAVVYEPKLARMLVDRHHFWPSSLLQCIILTRGLFLKSRLRSLIAIKIVFSHMAHRKPIFLVRRPPG